MSKVNVIVASHNPVKLKSVELAFSRMFPSNDTVVLPVQIKTGIPPQPLTDAETLAGAKIRAQLAQSAEPQADFWVGIEGGVEEFGTDLGSFAWVVIKSAKLTGQARSATFFLPHRVVEYIKQGKELGEGGRSGFWKDKFETREWRSWNINRQRYRSNPTL